jgi:predicted RNase H-like HicB family nuclease
MWDDVDKIYIVSVPEFPGCMTHGKTYVKAIKNALEAIELCIESFQELGMPVPLPRIAERQVIAS